MTLRRETPAVIALAFGQLLTYAAIYYAFPALLPHLLVQTGWSEATLAFGPTLSFLVMAALTPFTGRLVDRGLGGEMLVLLPPLSALALALIAFAPAVPAYYALWAVIGLAQAGMYYETCFSFLTRRLGEGARPAITLVTLIAGLAGTLAFPMGHLLGETLGARGALLVFAALIPLAVVPLNLWGVRRLRAIARQGSAAAPPPAPPRPIRQAMRRAPFWAIAGMYGALWLNHAILLTFVLLIFADQGAAPATAALAASCIGPSQVLGRLGLMMAERRIANGRATGLAVGSVVLAALVLIGAQGLPGLIFVFSLLQGAGVGVLSILRPVLIAQTLGRAGFGAVSGAIAVAPILATALGPSLGAWALGLGGARLALEIALGLALIGAGLALVLARTGLARAPGGETR